MSSEGAVDYPLDVDRAPVLCAVLSKPWPYDGGKGHQMEVVGDQVGGRALAGSNPEIPGKLLQIAWEGAGIIPARHMFESGGFEPRTFA
jgi:hypothetical protein